MRGMRRVVLLLLALALTACSSPSTPATAPAPVADGAGPVNEVLAALDGVMGDLQRLLVRDRRITTEVTDRLRAIYTGPELLNQIDAFRADVGRGLAGYKDPPGNRVTTVSRLITANEICVFAQVVRDYGPVTAGPAPPPSSLYVVLVDKSEADDPKRLNPTGWVMLYDGVQADGTQPEDVCS
jgi:hypothetical protein